MTSGIARTRLIDDWLAESLRGKEGRVIILGAGYDCRAYRIEALSRCRVLEIDHPDTQSQKMKMLVSDFGGLPPHVKLIGADLTKTDLRDVITGEAFASKEPAFVIWEGVTHYLGEAAVDGTLRALSDVLPAGSRLVFTYLHAGLLDGSVSFWGAGISKKQVAGEGEPWVWGMDPAGMPDYLKERGFALIEDLGADDYRERYWGQKGKRMRGFSFYRVALARSV